MQSTASFLDLHPFISLGLMMLAVLSIIWVVLKLVAWSMNTIQDSQAGIFKKLLALIIGILLLRIFMG